MKRDKDFPGGLVVKNLPANAGDTDSIPGLGRPHIQQSSWAHVPQTAEPGLWSPGAAAPETWPA